MRFLVTGASGFVGKSLCEELSASGHQVIAAARRLVSMSGVESYKVADWQDQQAWIDVLKDVDVVFHLAARVHIMNDTSENPQAEYREANLENTKVLANAVLNSSVQKFIFLSTIHINGTSSVDGPFSEKDVPQPLDHYAGSKLEAERYLQEAFKNSNKELVIVRPPLIYGPGCGGNFLRLMAVIEKSALLPFGFFKNKRSMIFIGNLVDFLKKVACTKSKNQVYLISDGEDLSFGSLVKAINRFMPSSVTVLFVPKFIIGLMMFCVGKSKEFHRLASDLLVDSSMARADFHWSPKYSVEDGLKHTVEWYLQRSKKTMKMLLVSQYFWPENFVLNSLSIELNKRGHDVTVLTGLPNYPQGRFFPGFSFWKGPWTQDYNGVKIIRVPIMPRGKGYFSLSINYCSFVLFGILPGLFRVGTKYDLIFCFSLSPVTSCLPGIFLKKFRTMPLVVWVQDLWPESVAAVGAVGSSFFLGLIGKIVRFTYRSCDLIMIQSPAFRNSVVTWGGDPAKLMYIPNWAKLPITTVQLTPTWIEQVPKGFKIVFAGNIGKAQDMPTVLKAAEILRQYSDIHWVIVGDGSEKEYVDQEIIERKLQKNVHTYGRRPSEDMPALFAKGDVMLVSLTNTPIFSFTVPSKIQAYMASAKPILSMLNGEGARVLAEADAGISCPAENAELLAESVLKFYRMSPEQRQRLGENGFEYFRKHFEETTVIDQIEYACQKLAGKE